MYPPSQKYEAVFETAENQPGMGSACVNHGLEMSQNHGLELSHSFIVQPLVGEDVSLGIDRQMVQTPGGGVVKTGTIRLVFSP